MARFKDFEIESGYTYTAGDTMNDITQIINGSSTAVEIPSALAVYNAAISGVTVDNDWSRVGTTIVPAIRTDNVEITGTTTMRSNVIFGYSNGVLGTSSVSAGATVTGIASFGLSVESNIASNYCFAGGGLYNTISTDSHYSGIIGGSGNTIASNRSVILGGKFNTVSAENVVMAACDTRTGINKDTLYCDNFHSFEDIVIEGSVSASTYYGDGSNLTGVVTSPAGSTTEIQINSGGSFGSTSNFVYDFTTNSLNFGSNQTNDAEYSVVLGGYNNHIDTNNKYSAIIGGYENNIFNSRAPYNLVIIGSNDCDMLSPSEKCGIYSSKQSTILGIRSTMVGCQSCTLGLNDMDKTDLSGIYNSQESIITNDGGFSSTNDIIIGSHQSGIYSQGGNYNKSIILCCDNSIISGATTSTECLLLGATENSRLDASHSAIIGGTGHTLTHNRSIILGGTNITSGAEDTVYGINSNFTNYYGDGSNLTGIPGPVGNIGEVQLNSGSSFSASPNFKFTSNKLYLGSYTGDTYALTTSGNGYVQQTETIGGLITDVDIIADIIDDDNWDYKEYIGSEITYNGQYYIDDNYAYLNVSELIRIKKDEDDITTIYNDYSGTTSNDIIVVNASGSTINLKLPTTSNSKKFNIKCIDATNVVTITNSIDGTSGQTMSQWDNYTLVSIGSGDYYIL